MLDVPRAVSAASSVVAAALVGVPVYAVADRWASMVCREDRRAGAFPALDRVDAGSQVEWRAGSVVVISSMT